MKKVWPFAVIIVVIVAVAAIALGNKNNKNAATPPPSPTSSSNSTSNTNSNSGASSSEAAVATNKVTISSFSYSPANITVKKNTTVSWTNNDTTAHTVTADDKSFDSGTMDHGKTISFVFTKVGTFKYHCTFHSDMHGTVTVTE
jgi:plastocyanin